MIQVHSADTQAALGTGGPMFYGGSESTSVPDERFRLDGVYLRGVQGFGDQPRDYLKAARGVVYADLGVVVGIVSRRQSASLEPVSVHALVSASTAASRTVSATATISAQSTPAEEMLVSSDYLNPRQHPNVHFRGDRLVERLNSAGHGAKVRTVLEGVRRYFGAVPVSVEWPESSPFGRPITIRLQARKDLDKALEMLDRFDNEWWFEQDVELHRLIGVHLA